MSDLIKSSDRKECIWVKEKVEQNLKSQLNISDIKILEDLLNILDLHTSGTSVFGICFSGEKDSLAQWREYANSGKGLSIGFDKKFLLQLNKNHPTSPRFNKIIYDINEQDEFCHKLSKSIYDKVAFLTALQLSIELSREHILDYAFFKNPTFYIEDEWRLCIADNPSKRDFKIEKLSFSKAKYRVANEKLISYIVMSFEEIANEFIKEIWIGPKCEVTEGDITNLLYVNDYSILDSNGSRKIILNHSKSTYR